MTATAIDSVEPVREDTNLSTAYRLLWLAVIFDFLAFGFAFTTGAIWVGSPGGPIIGTLMFIVGSLLADRIWSVVAVTTRTGVLALTTLAGIVMPALTGIIDLTLRARIP